MEKYTYLALLFISIAYPMLRSFENKLKVYSQWPAIFVSIFLTSIIFWLWDVWFTAHGIWKFNAQYVMGINVFGMPLEEWLFFIVIPYACFFIFFSVRHFIPRIGINFTNLLNYLSLFLFIILLIIYKDRLYTVVAIALSMAATLLIISISFIRMQAGYFYISYIFSLIPFFIINGILTYLPVVEYNNYENMNIRLGSIPLDDFIYLHSLLFINFIVYSVFQNLLKKEVE